MSADLPERAPQVAEEPGILVGVEQVRIAIAAWDDGQNAVRLEDLGQDKKMGAFVMLPRLSVMPVAAMVG